MAENRAMPLVLDSFEQVEMRPMSGKYDHQSQMWTGGSNAIEDVIASRQTHHKGEDH